MDRDIEDLDLRIAAGRPDEAPCHWLLVRREHRLEVSAAMPDAEDACLVVAGSEQECLGQDRWQTGSDNFPVALLQIPEPSRFDPPRDESDDFHRELVTPYCVICAAA